jgi:hypothetical protein
MREEDKDNENENQDADEDDDNDDDGDDDEERKYGHPPRAVNRSRSRYVDVLRMLGTTLLLGLPSPPLIVSLPSVD